MNKRNRGEGSIYQRKSDGRWVGVLSLGYGDDGKRKVKTFYGKSQVEVQKHLLKARSDFSKGLPVDIKAQTVQRFLEDWLENTIKPFKQPRSHESFSYIVKNHIVPSLGRIQLHKLQPQNVQTLLGNKLKAGLSRQTVAGIRNVLRTALNKAMKFGQVHRNVAALTEPIDIPRYRIPILTIDQAKTFLDAVKDTRFEGVFVLTLNLGMRRGEILGLPWSAVDFDKKVLRVTQQVQRIAGKVQICKDVKTDGSNRVIEMPEFLIRVLKTQKAIQSEMHLAAPVWQDNGLVFTTSTGLPIEPTTLNRDFKKYLKAAGLEEMRLHDLRHCCASLLLQQGVGLKSIQELLGHSSISRTSDTYSHINQAMRRQVADAMQEILGAS